MINICKKESRKKIKEEFTLFLAGDCMLGRSFNNLSPSELSRVWGNISNIISSSNYPFFAINLETSITNSNDKYPNKTFNFKINKEYAKVLFSLL